MSVDSKSAPVAAAADPVLTQRLLLLRWLAGRELLCVKLSEELS